MNKAYWKFYDCLVVETGQFKSFYYRKDADKFADKMTAKGFQVLRGESFDLVKWA